MNEMKMKFENTLAKLMDACFKVAECNTKDNRYKHNRDRSDRARETMWKLEREIIELFENEDVPIIQPGMQEILARVAKLERLIAKQTKDNMYWIHENNCKHSSDAGNCTCGERCTYCGKPFPCTCEDDEE